MIFFLTLEIFLSILLIGLIILIGVIIIGLLVFFYEGIERWFDNFEWFYHLNSLTKNIIIFSVMLFVYLIIIFIK